MHLTHEFEYFEPLTGELPDPYAAMFFELVHRARTLLKDRTSEQIKQAAVVLNRIYSAPNFVDPMVQAIEQESIKTKMFGREVDLIPSFTDVEALYQNIGNILLAEYHEFPGAQWYELFAVLTLSYAEMVCSEVHNQESWPPNHWLPKPTDSQIMDIAQGYLGLARQAITYAESLYNQEATVKRLISEHKKKAINSRHAKKTGPFKNEVLRLYFEKYSTRSNRDAASRILKELTDTGTIRVEPHTLFFAQEPVLNTDDPENRIEKWIGEAKKKCL